MNMGTHTASRSILARVDAHMGYVIDLVSFPKKKVYKGLAPDRIICQEEIPLIPPLSFHENRDLSCEDVAFRVFSLKSSSAEIPHAFSSKYITSTITLDTDQRIHLPEPFHGTALRSRSWRSNS